MELTHSQELELSRINGCIKKLEQKVLLEKQTTEGKPPSYKKERYINSVSYHKNRLETLRNEYKLAIEREEAALKTAQERLAAEENKPYYKSKTQLKAEMEIADLKLQRYQIAPERYPESRPVSEVLQPRSAPVKQQEVPEHSESEDENIPFAQMNQKQREKVMNASMAEFFKDMPREKPVHYTPPPVEEQPPPRIIGNTKKVVKQAQTK